MKYILVKTRLKKWSGENLLLATPLVDEQPSQVEHEAGDSADLKLKETQFFIERKLSSLHTAGHVCMTWWVSTIVFCGTILAAVWLQREEIGETVYVKWLLFAVLIIFFGGLAWFGYRVIVYLEKFKEGLRKFAANSNVPAPDIDQVFDTEVKFFINGMWIGTVCAAVILFAWIAFGLSLWWFKCCPAPPRPCLQENSTRSLSNNPPR